MWFWIFMFVMSLWIPIMLIGFGKWFQKRPPQKINSVYGYRTKMSMKNMETWNYAHWYCGKLWFGIGWGVLAVSALVMAALAGQNEDVIGQIGAVLMTGQCAALMLPIVCTEIELRRKFNADGTEKNKL